MSGNVCSHTGCERECFEGNPKCIFHCEKDDWFETVKDSPQEKKDWTKSQNEINKFWTEFKKRWNKGNYDCSHFVFPKFEKGVFQNLHQDYLKLPDVIKDKHSKEIVSFENAIFLDDG